MVSRAWPNQLTFLFQEHMVTRASMPRPELRSCSRSMRAPEQPCINLNNVHAMTVNFEMLFSQRRLFQGCIRSFFIRLRRQAIVLFRLLTAYGEAAVLFSRRRRLKGICCTSDQIEKHGVQVCYTNYRKRAWKLVVYHWTRTYPTRKKSLAHAVRDWAKCCNFSYA